MTSSSSITIANNFPVAMGTVNVSITDALQDNVQLNVPGNGTLQHPTDPANGPWTVQATLIGAGATASSVTGALTPISDPNAALTIGLDTVLAPAPTPDLEPNGEPADPTASSLGGLAASDTSSLFDRSHQTTVNPVEVPASHQLNMVMATQAQTNWCWAAVGSSVKAFFSHAAGPTQCSLATWAFGALADCCTGNKGSGAACNKPYYLDLALTKVGCLNVMRNQPMIFGDLKAEIAAGRPVGVRVQFSGGHFLCMDGYDASKPGEPTVDLKDPWYGSSIVKFLGFPGNYHNATAWSHSYLTKA